MSNAHAQMDYMGKKIAPKIYKCSTANVCEKHTTSQNHGMCKRQLTRELSGM